jgi:hypothetical protein
MITPVRSEACLHKWQLLLFKCIFIYSNLNSLGHRIWGCSSVGRARALHARGPDFDYLQLHWMDRFATLFLSRCNAVHMHDNIGKIKQIQMNARMLVLLL